MAEELRREVEVDTALAALYERLRKVNADLESNKLTLARFAGVEPVYVTRNRREVRETAAELAATVAGLLADDKIAGYNKDYALRTLAKRETLLGERAAALAEKEPLDDEFAAKPWSRFFLVQNHGGHIHSSMFCSTCRPTTLFGWLPDLSGLTEKDAVEAHGPLLCSVCYPTAPVEWTIGRPRDDSDKCPGSGERVANPSRRRYLECPTCGEEVSVTSTGKLRAHKPKEQS